MKTYFTLLVILAASGILYAADEPNTSPAAGAQKKARIMREHAGDGMRQNQSMLDGDHMGRGDIRERLAERYEEYVKWLEKNYPDEAAQLAKVKDENPENYMRRLKESLDKYGKLAYADKTDPNMAKVLRKDIELKAQIEDKLRQVHAATDNQQKQKLTDELRQLVSNRFDLIVVQKQLRYEGLNRKIENLKKEVKKQQSDLDKLKARKDDEVKKRVEELINQTDGIHWD